MEKRTVLKQYFKIFSTTEATSGLALKPAKCIIVLTATAWTPEVAAEMVAWLAREIPEWRGFKVKATGKYLGFLLGPAVTVDSQWKECLMKMEGRVDNIVSIKAAASVTTMLYNTRVASCAGYLGQLCVPPRGLQQLERIWLNRVLHMPSSTVSAKLPTTWADTGLLQATSVAVSCAAAMCRAALRTVPCWRQLHAELVEEATLDIPLARLQAQQPWDAHWQAPAMCAMLRAAVEGSQPEFWTHSVQQARTAIVRAIASSENDKTDLQGMLYRSGIEGWGQQCLCDLIKIRIQKWFPDSKCQIPAEDSLRASLKALRAHVCMHSLRTFLGGWCTAHRLQIENRPCKFGCTGGDDSLNHYYCCTPFIRALHACRSGFHLSLVSGDRSADSVFGLFPWNPTCASISSMIYHRLPAQSSFEQALLEGSACWRIWGAA